MILGRASISRWLSASRNSIPLITGMFQSSSTTSGIAASHCVSASRPSHASETDIWSDSRMCRATFRITLESSTTRQLFIKRTFLPVLDHDLGHVGKGMVNGPLKPPAARSEEHTSELQSLMRNSYAVFCLKKKTTIK